MQNAEIVLPTTKPETEWVRDRARRKVSPTRDHSRLQTKLAIALDEWARGRGEVGTEWRFRIEPPGERRRPLVPDVAYVANERLRGLDWEELQTPAFAPTVALEVLSPSDDVRDVSSKIDVYLRGGSLLVIIVDAATRTMTLHDPTGSTVVRADAILQHDALPGFALAVGALFADALDRTA